ncbi:hypothetical protein BDQ17DRAFT_1335097 [Cyathus striatus]|nr:hypothetical protein BDQ17DRAFT_1335097 [Cyathus striatus]
MSKRARGKEGGEGMHSRRNEAKRKMKGENEKRERGTYNRTLHEHLPKILLGIWYDIFPFAITSSTLDTRTVIIYANVGVECNVGKTENVHPNIRNDKPAPERIALTGGRDSEQMTLTIMDIVCLFNFDVVLEASTCGCGDEERRRNEARSSRAWDDGDASGWGVDERPL